MHFSIVFKLSDARHYKRNKVLNC